MTIPLHPDVIAARRLGDAFTERVAQARRTLAAARFTFACPDGDNQITFDGYGMVLGAQFAEDLFDRYTEEQLGDLLTEMCADGYEQIENAVTAVTDAALKGRQ